MTQPLERSRTLRWLSLGLAIGLAGGSVATYLTTRARSSVLSDGSDASVVGTRADASQSGRTQRKALLYHSAMNPNITSQVPRKDEMGMDFVPLYEDEVSNGGSAFVEGQSAVRVDPERQQLIGLRTVEVARGPIGDSWQTVGRVAVDQTRVRSINVKVDGYVEHLFVNYMGQSVSRGSPLMAVYSPELLSAQNELLLALQTQKRLAAGSAASGDDLVAAARRRLELWDVSPVAIERLERTGVTTRTLVIDSPITGVVTAKNVVEGMRVSPGTAPFEITDLSEVWVLADAYQHDLPRVRLGQKARFRTPALPGRELLGRVVFIDPVLDPKTRTAKLRLSFANPDGELRPDTFGEVVFSAPAVDVLRIPPDALIDSGREQFVFVDSGGGKLEPRSVKTGQAGPDWVEVLEGLTSGERVVTRANFLIDSESRLRAALSGIGRQPAVPAPDDGGGRP